PLELRAIQALLDDETVLLEYALGDARSYLWVVSARDLRVFTLAPRAEIEALALRVHDHVAGNPGSQAQPDSSRRGNIDDQRALRRSVVDPAAPLLAGKRLVLVLPGALSLVPFAALPDGNGIPLLAQHEIVQIPSATTLSAMRALTAERPRAARTAAV